MAVKQEQGEQWASQNVLVEGGLYLDKDVLFQATQMPGSARDLINFEPSLDGGYHRLLGYSKYDTNQMPHGASQVFGAVVNYIDGSVIAMQAGDTYRSTGTGWTKINSTDNHTGMGRVDFTFYSWSTSRFTFVDGDPNAFPVRVESGGSYTILTNAPKGQKFVQEFAGYLWLTAGDGNVTFSAPNADNDYNAIDGAGQINVGFPILGMGVWRGALYLFGSKRISQITGTSAADWAVTPLTDDIGMVASYTLQEINGDLVFLSSDGIRTISGTARIFDRELGVISRPINTFLVPLGSANWTSVPIRGKSQYRLFQGTGSTATTTAPGILGALKLQSNGSVAWEWAQTSGILTACASSGLISNTEVVVHGGFDGFVYQQENGMDFNGAAIQAVYRTPYLVYNDPNIRKILYKLCLNTRASGAATINVGVVFDYSSSSTATPPNLASSLSGGAWSWDDGTFLYDDGTHDWDIVPDIKNCVNLMGSGFSSSFSFTSNGGADYSIQALSIQYGQGARR